MTRSLRIAVADDEPDMQDYFRTILPRLGHAVVSVARTGQDLVANCVASHPDLVITDIKMPDMDGIQAAIEIYKQLPVPVILVSAHHDADFIRRAEADHILAYLVKPIKQSDLEPAIAIAMRRFEQFQALRKETTDLKQALEDRKIIERAKGVMMRKAGLDEADAFRRL
ncbi:MAG TPA: response regulator, partial [Isosphaeraceae bacterium]|nr:response regulator [Isosphaeraceae bacterium]